MVRRNFCSQPPASPRPLPCGRRMFINRLYKEGLPSTNLRAGPASFLSRRSRKEVFQPHLPVRLPCYDLAPITGFALGRPLRSRTSGAPGFHGLTGGVYKARERIHRAMADARLLANPASRGRVAGPCPNWGSLSGSARRRRLASLCSSHCNTCVAPDVRAVLI
jgi:hypothetical protein